MSANTPPINRNAKTNGRAVRGVRAASIVACASLAVLALLLASTGGASSAKKAKGGASTTPPPLQLDKAKVTLRALSSSGGLVTGWTVPAADGTPCAAFDIAELPRPAGAVGASAGPTLCVREPATSGETGSAESRVRARAAMVLYFSRPDGNFNVVVVGYAAPESGITRFALDGPTGSISSTGGQFVAELGVGTARGLPPRGGPYIISGYDAGGNRLSSDDVNARILAGTGS